MIALLDRIWRTIGTAASFALFGIGGLVLAITYFPALNFIIRDIARRERIAQQTIHGAFRFFVWFMCSVGAIRVRCEGANLLHAERGSLVISNHVTLIDVILIMACMDRTQVVVKAGVWRNPFMAGVVKAANYIPNLGDPERLLEDCSAALKSGNNLVIFPEGSRTLPGQKRRYQRGYAHVAVRTEAPIRLVTVACDPPFLLKGEPWWKVPTKQPCWVVRVHDRIELDDAYRYEQPSIAVRHLNAAVAKKLEDALAT
ncbi:MAG: lysophospholipid acyltransferase family protein [Caulobacterales bacterium]